MYTEDDEEVTVKKDNSNTKELDFYTSFNDIEKDDTKTKKSKKKKTPKKEEIPKEEEEYDFYGAKEDEIPEDNNDKKGLSKVLIIAILAIVLIVLLVLLFIVKGNKVKGDILLDRDNITLDVGGKEYISYKVVDTESTVTSKFTSSNENIVVVNENGEITALNSGDAIVIISYTIDGVTREKKCTIKVNDNGSVNQNIVLTLDLENGKDNVWTNKDVSVIPNASSIFGISSIKYAINCDSDCNYEDVSSSKITISSSGVTKVKVWAKDNKNQEATKEVTIKIDKEAPSVTLNSGTNIKASNDVEVCAICSDSLSGCKQSKVCKKYTSSKSNQTITVEDIVGNKKTSQSFNVTITRTASNVSCKLSVSKDGTVTAKVSGDTKYYGFNSSYSGSNELSKKITINASQNGESLAKLVQYYVKGKDGSTSKCFITVIKKCACANNSTDPNCSVSCTFTSQ